MNEMELLNWARGPALQVAVGIFVAGVVLRLIEILGLGRKTDLSPTRPGQGGGGWKTVFSRSVPRKVFMQGDATITYVTGYVFHIGLAVTVLLFTPHIDFIASVTGLHWPGLPSGLVDAVALITMAALVVALVHRLRHPVKRFLSGFDDYLSWGLTMLPLLTGYLAFHHMLLPYTTMLAVHILSVELMLVLLPFTKLAHAFSALISRWYNGAILGHKGAGL